MDRMCDICGGRWNRVRHVSVSHVTREWKRPVLIKAFITEHKMDHQD